LTPEVVGERHYELATRATAILQKYESLKGIIAIIGESELSTEDRDDYNKAKGLIEFFKQRFNVMEKVTGVPGEHMTREKTLDGVEEIIGKVEPPAGGEAEAKAGEATPTQPTATPASPTDVTKPTEASAEKPAEEAPKAPAEAVEPKPAAS